MRVIKRLPLDHFAEKYPRARQPLTYWYTGARRARWRNFADVRKTFGSTDQVRVSSGATVLVFDIGGNKFRLVAGVSYEKQKLYVLRVMTHVEYGTGLWKQQL